MITVQKKKDRFLVHIIQSMHKITLFFLHSWLNIHSSGEKRHFKNEDCLNHYVENLLQSQIIVFVLTNSQTRGRMYF